MDFHTRSSLLVLIIYSIVGMLISISKAHAAPVQPKSNFNNSVSALFIFGDSTVDPGNNNYIETPFKSNFPPYGRDFVNHIPTGRFTNGRLVTDFVASYGGIKDYVPPYLDPTLSVEELLTGVSFASAGSGFDPLTSQLSLVISVSKQVEYFREYKTRVELAIGKKRSNNLIKAAIFVVSAGTNDFIANYFGAGAPVRQQTYSVSTYLHFLMQNIQHFIQGLRDEGARQIVVVGLPPMGCLPVVITLHSGDAFHQRGCIETLSSVARDYNRILQNKLKAMRNSSLVMFYADIYKPLSDMIQRHQFGKWVHLNNSCTECRGVDEVNIGCCGTGFFETSILCSQNSPVCFDASKYVFWDSIHPTEKAYYIIFQSLRSTIDSILAGHS